MKTIHRLTVLVFILMLGVPPVIMLTTPNATISVNENRYLAQVPNFRELLGHPIKDTFNAIERYVSDQFGLRDALTSIYGFLMYYALRSAPRDSVLIGEDGWLYYSGKASEYAMDDYRGLIQLSDTYLQNAAGYLQTRKNRLTEQGIRYIFVLAPDKQSIYPEFVPSRLNVVSTYRRIDQFLAYMRAHTDVEFVDLRAPLLEAKASGTQVFFRTDTHWNTPGAYAAYQAITRALGLPASVGWRPVPILHTGDLGKLMGLPPTEMTVYYEKPDACAKEGSPELAVSLPYWIESHNFTCTAANGRALIFYDSFLDRMQVFLAENFGQTTFAKARYAPEIAEPLIGLVQPTVVIEEIVERRLNSYFDYSPAK